MTKGISLAQEIESCFDRLWPLLRSITGDGVRKTHDILSEIAPLQRIEIPSGTRCFEWTVPKEWVVREAWVETPTGRRILDVRECNLHLLNYSIPFTGRVSKSELDQHLYSVPDLPDAVPYVTSYYVPRWGFCIAHKNRLALADGEYYVHIDTEHVDGSLTISEVILPGASEKEIVFSTYTCHPSMANDQLSGPLVQAFLCRRIAELPSRRFTYRFVWLPETIGSICYLVDRGPLLKERLVAGYVLACCGDDGPFTYKCSRRGNTVADRIAKFALETLVREREKIILDFEPFGSDE